MTEQPALQAIFPPDAEGLPSHFPPSSDEFDLGARYYHEPTGRRAGTWVRANMISTVDGAIRGANMVSSSINGPADFRVFQILRALASVVVVGSGTVRAEGYDSISVSDQLQPLRQHYGLPRELPLAIVTGSGSIPASALSPNTIALTTTSGAAALRADHGLQGEAGEPEVVITGEGADVDLTRAFDALRERGLTHILTEGGPSLLGDVARAGLVDELCLTWAPSLLGGGSPAITGRDPLGPVPLTLTQVLVAPDSTLLTRWLVN